MSARIRPSTASAIISQRPATSSNTTKGTAIRMNSKAGANATNPPTSSASSSPALNRGAVSAWGTSEGKAASASGSPTTANPSNNAPPASAGGGAAAAMDAQQQQLLNDPVAIQEETQRIEDRIHLLEMEGRSNYERTSAEQRSLREEINRLRTDNKEMKATLTNAKRGGGGNVIENEIRQLDNAICSTTLKLDRITDMCTAMKKKIEDQHSTSAEIEKNSRPVLVEGSALDKKIRALENRLDKSLIKYNEAVSIKKTYEQILKRLREEQVGFDNQLQAIEKTLSSKSHDYQELLSMSHQANAAKEAAKKELQDFQQAYAAERIAKDDQLAKKKAYVQMKADQTFKLEKREKQLRQKEAEAARQEMEEEQAQQQALLNNNTNANRGGRTNTDIYGSDDEERLAQYEAAFKTIKDATGVSDANELLQKYVTQEETRRQLQSNVHESQSRIDRLQSEIDELTGKLEELRYSGSGQLGSRRIVEEFEAHLAETRHVAATNGAKYEAITKLLISTKAGIEHLLEITQGYKHRVAQQQQLAQNSNNTQASASAAALPIDITVVDDDTAVDALRVVEQRMIGLIEEVIPTNSNAIDGGRGFSSPNGQLTTNENGQNTSSTTTALGLAAGVNDVVDYLPAYNTRIKIPKYDDVGGGDLDDDDGSGSYDGGMLDDPSDDAVLKRDQVKKISINAIQRETKKLKRRRK